MTSTTAPEIGRAARIDAALRAAFPITSVRIVDESALHHGHSGSRPEGETHYRVELVSTAFVGMNRVARHRAVNAALVAEFDTGLHALAIVAKSPEE